MKRNLIIAITVASIVSGIFLLISIAFFQARGLGALRISSNIKSKVYLNNSQIGETPLCKCDQNETITQGEYMLKIAPEDSSISPFLTRIKINTNTLTAVDRTFFPGSLSSAYTLYLEKISDDEPQLSIVSLPDQALVTIDGVPQSITPYFTKNITASEHEIEIKKPGFSKKTIRVRTVAKYKLIASVILGTEITTASDSKQATGSAALLDQASASKSATVKIKDTPTGFLRVRENPSISAKEIARVSPNDVLTLIDEQNGWYKVQLKDGLEGWVSTTYAEKKE